MRDRPEPVPALLCLPVELVLHRLGGREGQLLRRSDLDGLAGRRIAAFTRRAVLYLEFRSEEHTSELQSLMRISYAVFCLKKKTQTKSHSPSSPNYPTHINY